MKRPEIQFRATTIIPRMSISGANYEAGAYTGTVYEMLYYLEQCGIVFTRQTLYKVKGQEYLVAKEKNCNPVVDWAYSTLALAARDINADITIRIERI